MAFLRQQARDYIAVNIREAEVTTGVAVGQPLVVKAQKKSHSTTSRKSSSSLDWKLGFYASSPGTTLP
jgi:hypothetical protein